MFKMKKILLALLIIVSISTAHAQNEVDVDLTADFVSSTIWRGSYLGGASVQPEVSVGWRGLELSAWGSAGVADGSELSADPFARNLYFVAGFTIKAF